MGMRKGSAAAAPSRGELRRRWGQAADELWARYRLPPSQAGEKGGGDRPAMGTNHRRVLVRRGPGGRGWSLAQTAAGELWPGGAGRRGRLGALAERGMGLRGRQRALAGGGAAGCGTGGRTHVGSCFFLERARASGWGRTSVAKHYQNRKDQCQSRDPPCMSASCVHHSK